MERLGMGSQQPWLDSPPLLKGDRASLPVLLELVHAADPKYRQVGVAGLGAFRDLPAKKIAMPALTATLDDPDPVVRLIAASALQRMKDP